MAKDRILIVDDNPSNVKLARLLLEKADFEVHVAGDSDEALQAVQAFPPRLIVMDIQLPGMDGLSLTRLLRAKQFETNPVIVAVTAYAMTGDQERVKAAGCDGYISKPINTRTFVDQIKSFLKVENEPSVQEDPGDPNDVLAEVRNGFLAEGVDVSQRYADPVLAGNNSEAIRRAAHHWAGMGGTLGFPEITAVGREIEALIVSRAPGWEQQVAQRLTAVNATFSQLMKSGEFSEIPLDVAQDLASKQVGLVGFSVAESARVRGAFDKVRAVVRDLGSLAEGLGMDALHTHDLILLNACTNDGIRSWDSVLAQPVLAKPLLVVASRAALVDTKLALMDRAADFLVEPWDPEELLFRAYKVLGGAPPVAKTQAPVRKSKPKVILADDDPFIHSLLTPMLNKLGMDCYTARDGRAAIDLATTVGADLLILDIGMPGVTGMTVLRELKRVHNLPNLKILMLSARQQRSDISMALAFGANDYAVKPFDPEDLMLRISQLLPAPEPCPA
jgi:DNA-binding response OmpR family regulator